MLNKPFDAISKDDIENLISNRVSESKMLEYKEALTGNTDEDKREFLADVSSFANASGGTLIYGIREQRDVSAYVLVQKISIEATHAPGKS